MSKKFGKDWRHPDGRRDDFNDKPRKKHKTNDDNFEEDTMNENRSRKPREPKVITPIQQLLGDCIVNQINAFLALSPDERAEGAKDLFNVGPYPSGLESDTIEDIEKYRVYQLDRSVRIGDDPEKLRRLSTAILVTDSTTGLPAYYITAFITPSLEANCKIVPYDDNGPVYRNSFIWDTRDRK